LSILIRSIDDPHFDFCAPHGNYVAAESNHHVGALTRSIQNLCKYTTPVSKAQLIPENALLATCMASSANGRLSFLEILPTDLCNHACTWCFTASSRSTKSIDADALRNHLENFIDGGGKSILISGGGEPLLFKPLYESSPMFGESTLVQWISSRGAASALITNGVFLDRFLRANEDCFQSLAFLRVSLDAHSASRYQQLHAARPGDYERVLRALRRAVELRGDSPTPAIGISFIVDPTDSLNCSRKDFEAIDCLASITGVDFVQIKHVHTADQVAADSVMMRIGELLAQCSQGPHEWWVHRYFSSPADTDCAVPLVAQVLRSDGKRSPCCHLQHLDVQDPADAPALSPFRVTGCRSAACRYVSMNHLLKVLEQGGTEYVDALRRLKLSLERDGFHPYRLFPSAPDLVPDPLPAR
jgi:wyosine [tRNA(Phe)-imidazoG37] synthetase (radical SAM superfamily)